MFRYCLFLFGGLFFMPLFMPHCLAQQAAAASVGSSLPDLQGVWSYTALTPLQRPPELGEQRSYRPDELAALENRAWQRRGAGFGYAAAEFVHLDGEVRTSLVIAPPDGRIPYRLQAASARQPGQWARLPSGPEMFSARDRCLSGPAPLPLLAPEPEMALAERSIRIVQTGDYLVISQPAFAALRIIRLDPRQSLQPLSRWWGDAVATWDGDSLVINTSGFRREQSNLPIVASAGLQIYERFTPLANNRLRYTYTVFDPDSYQQPFTVEMPLTRSPESILQGVEGACHEHNLSLPAALLSARLREAAKP